MKLYTLISVITMQRHNNRKFESKTLSGQSAKELEVVSKPQITFKGKAQLDEKAEHIQ